MRNMNNVSEFENSLCFWLVNSSSRNTSWVVSGSVRPGVWYTRRPHKLRKKRDAIAGAMGDYEELQLFQENSQFQVASYLF